MNLKNLTLLEIPSRHRSTTHPRVNLEVSVQKDFKSQKVKSKDSTSVRLRIKCPDKGAMVPGHLPGTFGRSKFPRRKKRRFRYRLE